MTLVAHLRELRNRLAWSMSGAAVGTVIGWVYYPQVFALLSEPFRRVVAELDARDSDTVLAMTGIADAFNTQFQLAAATGVVLSSPLWLYQAFRFVTPGLNRRERLWAGYFVLAALPLFLCGVVGAYFALPRVLEGFLGFTPDGVSNVIGLDRYLSFFVQLMLAFGAGCISPALVVTLNAAGLLTFRQFAERWRWVVLFTLAFAGIATPTGDPVALALFAAPLGALMLLATGIIYNTDRVRASRERRVSDDEASPLDDVRLADDDLPSSLDSII